MTLVALLAMTTGAWADDYTITLPTVSNGSVVAKVNDVSVTSAAADATVTLVATPDAGYKLKTIGGTSTQNASETFSSGANTRTGTHFRVSGNNFTYGWRVGTGNNYTLTISSLSNQNLSQVVLTVGNQPNTSGRNTSHLQVDKGSLTVTGTSQGSTVTITNINSPSVTLSAPSSSNAASMWTFTQAKVDGLGSVALTLTDTGDDNVKTFTMPSGNVTVSAEFEEIPFVAPEVIISTDQQSAEFDMPSYDATLEYDIVRNLASNMTVSIGDGQDGYRIRVKKQGESFVPAEMTLQQMMALYTVHDATEQKDLLFYGDGKVCDISIFAVDDQGQPTGQPVAFTALTPGRYVAIATAPDDSPLYAGQTPQSNIFVLYQGYEVTVPAGEYITYYKDENLYVEDENAELYTISSVTATEAQLSDKITVAPANTPLLVYNNSSTEAKTFLLIPTTDKTPDNVTPATQFVGTLEATTIPASTTSADNYALNGKAFVWVKTAIDVAANKCWLQIGEQPATARRNTRSIVGGGNATGIESIHN